jgi:molybdopterin-guanine dinucleotide biosynthesis protein A
VNVPYPEITGALLAGGRATRMGGLTKGLLSLDGRPLLGRSLELFALLFGGALLVTNDPAAYRAFEVATAPDLIEGRGPPGGLHAALSAAPTPWVFLAGCDMPHLSREGIALLASRRGAAKAVVPSWGGRLEPLHALWSREALPLIGPALREGEPSLWRLARLVGAAVVEDEDWSKVDPGGLAFENANTEAEAARLGLTR